MIENNQSEQAGRIPALQFARISLARDLIRQQKNAGLTQQRLADLAGIRQETLSRIENGKHTANPRTVDKILRVIETRQRRKSGGKKIIADSFGFESPGESPRARDALRTADNRFKIMPRISYLS